MMRKIVQNVFYHLHNRVVTVRLYTNEQCTDYHSVAVPNRLTAHNAMMQYAKAEAELFAFRHDLAAWQVHEDDFGSE